MLLRESVCSLLAAQDGVPIRGECGPEVSHLLRQLGKMGVDEVWLHAGARTRALVSERGAHALCHRNHIYLGSTAGTALAPPLEHILRHELIHVAQTRRGETDQRRASQLELEQQADTLATQSQPDLSSVSPADPDAFHPLVWLLPMAAAAYVLLRPNIANAPGPRDKTYKSVSPLQVAGEAMALFVVPTGVFALGGRLGLGYFGASALSGAAMTTSLRGVHDLGAGQFSGAHVYVYDAATGAVIGVLVPGGIRLIGAAGTRSLDWLATQGLRRADFALAKVIVERAARTPLTHAEVASMLEQRRLTGRMADWWLNRRGQIILYRGQEMPSVSILSPMAREGGVQASEALVARIRAAGVTDAELASFTAQLHHRPLTSTAFGPAELLGERVGAAGIPTTQLPGVAANFGESGVMYIIRIPKGAAIKVPPWGLAAEHEWIILNQIPKEFIIDVIPAARVPALTVNEAGLLIPAR